MKTKPPEQSGPLQFRSEPPGIYLTHEDAVNYASSLRLLLAEHVSDSMLADHLKRLEAKLKECTKSPQ